MTSPPIVPPLKCQGIKTKLVPILKAVASSQTFCRWIEPFSGSGVVAFNIQPKRALLCDTNKHIVRLYQDIQSRVVNEHSVREYLTERGFELSRRGEPFYYEMRERFNKEPNSLDFLFLNRSCFNGVMRFNKKGFFNVPYCHKPERFAQAYVTKIANQVRRIGQIVSSGEWCFAVQDFRTTLDQVLDDDLVYADPPYAGRHVDYFNSWSDSDETSLHERLQGMKGKFMLSTWCENKYRVNPTISEIWERGGYKILRRNHFYHVGSTEDLRNPMVEGIVCNFNPPTLHQIEPLNDSDLELDDQSSEQPEQMSLF